MTDESNDQYTTNNDCDNSNQYSGGNGDWNGNDRRRRKDDGKAQDINGDGVIDMSEVELQKTKMQTQRRIAFIALLVLCFLGIYIAVWMPLDRVAQVAAALDLLWVTLGGVIATYMGAEAYITRK